MKICTLSHSDGRVGGYAAAYRLHQGFVDAQMDATMVVGISERSDETVWSPQRIDDQFWVRAKPFMGNLPTLLYPQRDRNLFSLAFLPDSLPSWLNKFQPDVINLHWVNAEFMNLATLRHFKCPVVWTLHDMWVFTGGCHYDFGCDRYVDSCGHCPQLNSKQEWDLSKWVWGRKHRQWRDLTPTLVTPSRWLADCVGRSSLCTNWQVKVIANGLNLRQYQPFEVQLARDLLQLPKDKRIITFGAINALSDRRKGFHLLVPALQKLSDLGWQDQAEVVIFGANQPRSPTDLKFNCHYLGQLNDDLSLRLIYAASDVVVVPSLQESFGQTASESLACGTPVVAFNHTGLQDIVDHQDNGYLAQPFATEDLALGIDWVMADRERYYRLCDRARQKAEREFCIKRQARRYVELFEELLSFKSIS